MRARSSGTIRTTATRAAWCAGASLLAVVMGGCMAMESQPSGSWLKTRYGPPAGRRIVLVEPAEPHAFEEGVELAAEHKYIEAEAKFAQVLSWSQAANDRPRAAEATFWLGFCKEKQGRLAEARDRYRALVDEYPGTPAAAQADKRRAQLTGPPGGAGKVPAPAPRPGPSRPPTR